MNMKTTLKSILIRLGLFYDLRWSKLFLWYRDRVDPAQKRQNEREARFLKSFFKGKKPKLIFDIGANDGTKAAQFLHLHPTRLVCVEPDPKNHFILKARFRNQKNVTIQSVAVSDRAGQQEFFILHDGDSLNSLSTKWRSILEDPSANRWTEQTSFERTISVQAVTITQLIEQFGVPDYCKIDVEGHEWACISDLKQAIPVLSFECNLPEFLEESIRCLEHLNRLDPGYAFAFYADGDTFLTDRFCDLEEAKKFIETGRYNYLEVFAISKPYLTC